MFHLLRPIGLAVLLSLTWSPAQSATLKDLEGWCSEFGKGGDGEILCASYLLGIIDQREYMCFVTQHMYQRVQDGRLKGDPETVKFFADYFASTEPNWGLKETAARLVAFASRRRADGNKNFAAFANEFFKPFPCIL